MKKWRECRFDAPAPLTTHNNCDCTYSIISLDGQSEIYGLSDWAQLFLKIFKEKQTCALMTLILILLFRRDLALLRILWAFMGNDAGGGVMKYALKQI